MKRIKYLVYQKLYSHHLKGESQISLVESGILILIVLNIIAIMLESYPNLEDQYRFYFDLFELLSIAIFTIEYFLRIWVADLKYPGMSPGMARYSFIFSVHGIIDLLAILPFYIPLFITTDWRFLRILRLTRIIRVLKLNRYSRSMQLVGDVLKEIRNDLIVTFMVCMMLLMVASTIMFYVEHDAQPDRFHSILDSFWWGVATLTTVGYGDIYPITGWGKFISGVIALLGIALLALPTSILTSAFIDKLNKRKAITQTIKTFCPHCGNRLND